MSSLKPAQLVLLFGVFHVASGCGGGGYDGPAGMHPYPPPGDFGEVGTGGGSTAPGSSSPEKASNCVEQRNRWSDWEQSFAPGIASPQAIFAAVDHEVKTPLYWAKGPVDEGRLSWNVAGQSTHLTVQLSIDPGDRDRNPVFVASRPRHMEPKGTSPSKSQLDKTLAPGLPAQSYDCPSYWELPVSIRVSTQDLALRETRLPGILQVGSGGVSRLIATIPAQELSGDLQWMGGGQAGVEQGSGPSSTAGSSNQGPASSVQNIELNAWMAKGIMWAQLTGQLSSNERFSLADGNQDDPRCEDGHRLKVGIDHPLGKLSAQQVIKGLNSYRDYLLHWEGQEPQALRLAAISPPKEVCIDVNAQQGPSAALDMRLRMTFVDDKQQRALTLAPHVRAALDLSAKEQINLNLRYHAFSRSGESLPDFLTRHGLTLGPATAPDSGIFELSMQISNQDHKTLSGSMSLVHFSQAKDCPDATQGNQKDKSCEALHGTSLRTGTLIGSQPDGSM